MMKVGHYFLLSIDVIINFAVKNLITSNDMPYFSVITPVYNRPVEVDDLLRSLAEQSYQDFEVFIVEDGSTVRCDEVAERYNDRLDLHYHYK